MPKIESLFTFKDVWDVAGPLIITGIIIFIVGIIAIVILGKMNRGLMKDLFRILFLIGIAFVTYFSLQITSNIWSH